MTTDNQITPPADDEEEDDLPVGTGTFTQEQVNYLIRARLRRQKARLDHTFAALNAENVDLKSKLEAASQWSEKYRAENKKTLEVRRKGLPNGILQLLDKLEPEEQLSWLDTHAAEITPAPPPATPPETPNPQETRKPADVMLATKKASGNYSI